MEVDLRQAEKASQYRILEILAKRVEVYQHNLWEEEKHYSQWVYWILTAIVAAHIASINIEIPLAGLIVGIGGGLLGIYLSRAAFFVLRREGDFLVDSINKYNNMVSQLNSGNSISIPEIMPPLPGKQLKELLKGIIPIIFNSGVNNNSGEHKYGIRDSFQITFLLTALLFIFAFIYSVVNYIITA